MKLESQVASLGLSKKLRDLGVVQESAFYWDAEGKLRSIDRGLKWHSVGAAFTVAELGKMLPGTIEVGLVSGQARRCLVIGKTLGDQWRIDYRNEKLGPPIVATADTESDARAKMLIYLIENKMVTVDEVNERMRRAA